MPAYGFTYGPGPAPPAGVTGAPGCTVTIGESREIAKSEALRAVNGTVCLDNGLTGMVVDADQIGSSLFIPGDRITFANRRTVPGVGVHRVTLSAGLGVLPDHRRVLEFKERTDRVVLENVGHGEMAVVENTGVTFHDLMTLPPS